MTPSRADYLLLALLGLCWGSNFLAIKLALPDMPPATLVLGRLATGAAVLLIVLKAKRLALPRGGRVWAHLALVALFGNALPYWLIAWAELHVTSALAGVLIGATPLLTMLLAHVAAPDERLTLRRTAGVGLGFVGILALIGIDALAGLGAHVLAQLALIGAGACYAISAVAARRMPKTAPQASAFAVTGLAALMVFPVAVGHDGTAGALPGWAALAAVLWLGLVSTAVAMLTYFRLVASAGPTFLSLANYLVPLIAFGLGNLLLGEVPTWNMWLALALILAGVALTGGRPQARAAA